MPGDAEESGMDLSSYGGQNYSKPKPQTPASGTTSPGTATQTQTVPKPPKPPKPDVISVPKPANQGNSGHNVGSTQNGTVTLPNGTTVYKTINNKTPNNLK